MRENAKSFIFKRYYLGNGLAIVPCWFLFFGGGCARLLTMQIGWPLSTMMAVSITLVTITLVEVACVPIYLSLSSRKFKKSEKPDRKYGWSVREVKESFPFAQVGNICGEYQIDRAVDAKDLVKTNRYSFSRHWNCLKISCQSKLFDGILQTI